MSSILNAEIADYRHAELVAEADMVRRARVAGTERRAALLAPRRAGSGEGRPARSRRHHPLAAMRTWVLAGQL